MNNNITVILNGFKRGRNLSAQIKAIQNQTIKADDIFLWYNYPGNIFKYNVNVIKKTKSVISNHNWGVWARFYFALNAKTKYICIFDDDTIPGKRWLENCLNTIKSNRGLLGTIGLIYDSQTDYFKHTRYGWDNPNAETKQVDIVGHSWFFEREFLVAFCREQKLLDVDLCGEDIHFSYSLQKYMNLNTYVPPHPEDDQDLWGSIKGWKLGVDTHAISHQHKVKKNDVFTNGVNDYYKECITKGWRLINFDSKANDKINK
jgi:hypothetical protein